MFSNGLLQETIQLCLGRLRRPALSLAAWQAPVAVSSSRAAPPLQPVARKQFLNALHQGPRCGYIVKRQITIQTMGAQPALDLGVNQNRLQFRAEVQVLAADREVQRLDPHAIASQDEATVRLPPERHREHPPQPREALRVPLEEGIQQRFGVASGAKAISTLLQFPSQFQVVVDLAIENDDGVAIL